MPAAAEFTFNEDIIGTFSQAIVVGADGDLRSVRPTSEGPRVTVPLTDDLGTGKMTVRYRVTSNDAHTVAGEISFTVGAASASVAPGPTESTISHAPDSNVTGPRTDERLTSARDMMVSYVLAGVGAALLVGGGAFLLRGQGRRKLPLADQPDAGSGSIRS